MQGWVSSHGHDHDGYERVRLGVQRSHSITSMVAWMTPVNRLLCSHSVEDGGNSKRLEQLRASSSATGVHRVNL